MDNDGGRAFETKGSSIQSSTYSNDRDRGQIKRFKGDVRKP